MSGELERYILEHTEAEPEYLYRLWRATNIHTIHGRMASGHLQGRLLKMIVKMVRPKNILEIGTFSGYSAISMAEGLADDGHLYTFEINDEMEDFTRPWIEGSEVADKIRPTTRSGTDMWWTMLTTRTSRRRVLRPLMTTLPAISEWSR